MPLMLYVFSDGSLSSSGMIDNSVGGRGKGVWTGDNQSTAATFFLVYNPKAPIDRHPQPDRLLHGRRLGGEHRQPGRQRRQLLAEMVVLNYMALHGQEGAFQGMSWAMGVPTSLGSMGSYSSLIGMPQIV